MINLTRVINSLGASAFFYSSVQLRAGSLEPCAYENLVGGLPELIQTYISNRWFEVDPTLLYSQVESDAFVGSRIGLLENLQGSWRDIGVAARLAGIGSVLAIPLHTAEQNRYATFRVATPVLPASGGEEALLEEAQFFSLAGTAIHNWMRARRRQAMLANSGLTSMHLKLLQSVARGNTVSETAKELGLTKRELYGGVFREICEKTGTDNINDAAQFAVSNGLIHRALTGMKVAWVLYSKKMGCVSGHSLGNARLVESESGLREGRVRFSVWSSRTGISANASAPTSLSDHAG